MTDSQSASLVASLAQSICGLAGLSSTEEDLRIGVEKLLEPALQELGIGGRPGYERQIRRTVPRALGRADALYGQTVIEYEPPGRLSTTKGLASTRKQLEDYLLGIAGSDSQREARLRPQLKRNRAAQQVGLRGATGSHNLVMKDVGVGICLGIMIFRINFTPSTGR